MAPAIVHFLVGASILLIVATPIAWRYDLDWRWPLWLVAVGGIWGLFPDVHHIAPVFEARLRAFHDSTWADLFAFHYTLDRPAVRARYIESVFGSIAGFLAAIAAFTLSGSAGDDSSSGPRDRQSMNSTIAVSLFALLVGIALGGLLYATFA